MRDKNRIPKILRVIGEVWNKYPDMRFGQLVVNCLGTDPFYVEDNVIEKKFKTFGNIQMNNISTDNMEIIEKYIPTKFIKIENEEVELSDFINTIEEVLDTVPNSDSFVLKDYDATSEKTLEILKKMDYVEKKYGERQSIVYTIKCSEKKKALTNLYKKILYTIE